MAAGGDDPVRRQLGTLYVGDSDAGVLAGDDDDDGCAQLVVAVATYCCIARGRRCAHCAFPWCTSLLGGMCVCMSRRCADLATLGGKAYGRSGCRPAVLCTGCLPRGSSPLGTSLRRRMHPSGIHMRTRVAGQTLLWLLCLTNAAPRRTSYIGHTPALRTSKSTNNCRCRGCTNEEHHQSHHGIAWWHLCTLWLLPAPPQSWIRHHKNAPEPGPRC